MGTEVTQTQPMAVVADDFVEGDLDMVRRIQARITTVQYVFKQIMKADSDYGKIPGCGDKPSLLKPGAEKLMLAFRIAPTFRVEMRGYDSGHREYEVICTLTANDGTVLGEGLGCCSTLESKYRYRTGPKEFTGRPVPKEYWDMRNSNPVGAQAALGGAGFRAAKNDDGMWEICRQGEKAENADPADQYNTVLKMAKKRALVDAALTVLGASDIFTQDIEDMQQDNGGEKKQSQKNGNSTPTKQTPSQSQKPTQQQQSSQQAKKPSELYAELKDQAMAKGGTSISTFSLIVNKFLQPLDKTPEELSEAEFEKLVSAIKNHKPEGSK